MPVTRQILVVTALALRIAQAGDGDDTYHYDRARELAFGKQRAEAIRMLDRHLREDPGDSDARVLLGIVLSWEGRYDEARAHLKQVLDGHPDHGDALPALINVEMWSDHPEAAEALARDALARHPDDVDLLLARAKALRAMGDDDSLRGALDQILRADPTHEEANEMSSALDERSRLWQLGATYSYDWFDDHRDPWHEASLALKRTTPVGPVIGRVSYAHRFGLSDEQYDADFYPKLRPGTYMYLNAGFSPDHELYPRYRVGADLYQSIGWGLEPSIGFRHLEFDSAVSIYVLSLTKYWSDWAFIWRAFLTPDSAGTSYSGHLAARRYFADGVSYVGLRYGHGSSPEEIESLGDIEILDSDILAADAVIELTSRVELTLGASAAREERASNSDLYHYSVSAGLSFRF